MLNYSNFVLQINKLEIFDKNSRIAVGVSGGIDSITLVYLLSKWAKIKNFNLIVEQKFMQKQLSLNIAFSLMVMRCGLLLKL